MDNDTVEGMAGRINYYNDNDSRLCRWLENLIGDGRLPDGSVDCRNIEEIQPNEIRQYRQAHFFAGIGGWPLALRLAGWPDNWPVWTGSCPCQPFSVAGKRKGTADERHLWPAFRRLISECQPPVVFGEQVASKDGLIWLAGVRADLEACGYVVGAADLCAASVGAPHIRQRLWWVAISESIGRRGRDYGNPQGLCGPIQTQGRGTTGGLGDASSRPPGEVKGMGEKQIQPKPIGGFWSDFILIPCRDGKARRTQPGISPLAHGVPGRVVKLRAYGNAIVPQVAAVFIETVMGWLRVRQFPPGAGKGEE